MANCALHRAPLAAGEPFVCDEETYIDARLEKVSGHLIVPFRAAPRHWAKTNIDAENSHRAGAEVVARSQTCDIYRSVRAQYKAALESQLVSHSQLQAPRHLMLLSTLHRH